MASRPVPTEVVHFTHIHNLEGIIESGLHSDAHCRQNGLTDTQIGDLNIRERRLALPVGAGPGGFVGGYVPFYYGPRSPMMFTLDKNDQTFSRDCSRGEIVYLVTTIERVVDAGHRWVASNRNAALSLADFTDDIAELDDHVAWEVMSAKYWRDFDDGKDLRMAEFLVPNHVPWELIGSIVVRSHAAAGRVHEWLASAGHRPQVIVRPGWYF